MKKLLSVVMALCMVMLVSVSAFASFSDMPAGKDGEVLAKAVENGLIQGFEDGTIRPDETITRAQMAAIIVRATNAEKTEDISSFNDITADAWYYDVLSKAVSMGAFKGDDKKCLNPNSTITRQEAFIVFCRIFDLPDASISILSGAPDGDAVSTWAREEVGRVMAAGYIDTSEAIRPLAPMTRIEFARIMDKLVATFIDKEGEYTSLPEGNVMVRANNVSFKGVKTNSVLIIGDGVTTPVKFDECEIEKITFRGAKGIFNSGTYGLVRAVGNGTEIYIMKRPLELLKKYEDGSTGKFSAEPGKGVLVPLTEMVELQ